MNAQEIATCCRLSWMLMAGSGGPRFAQVNVETLFVRDADFMVDLARDMADRWSDVSVRFGEIAEANRVAAEENASRRRLRSEALLVASDVVDVMRSLRRNHEYKWRMFQKMIGKQTLRQIVRRSKDRSGESIAEDIGWCSGEILRVVGEERLETLLTLRSIMA